MTKKKMTELDVARIYKARFSPEERVKKEAIWRVLCSDFFQRYVKSDDTVLDIGAGYCEFINNIVCARKIALDINKDTALYAASDVQVLHYLSDDMRPISDSSIDVVFVSNFFEHLPDKETFIRTIREVHRILRIGGRILVLQPNIRFIPGEYWDFLDHYIPLTDRTIVEGLTVCGIRPIEVRPRFLPYTTKSLFSTTSTPGEDLFAYWFTSSPVWGTGVDSRHQRLEFDIFMNDFPTKVSTFAACLIISLYTLYSFGYAQLGGENNYIVLFVFFSISTVGLIPQCVRIDTSIYLYLDC